MTNTAVYRIPWSPSPGGDFLLAEKERLMTQAELNTAVAQATGEDRRTIAHMGFVPLTRGPVERDREPLVVDWDEVDGTRAVVHPLP